MAQSFNNMQDLNKIYKKEEKGLFGFFIRHFRFTYLIILAVVIFGGYAMLTLTRASEPEVKVPIAVVSTVYPGATPVDVEELITNPIEKSIADLDQLKKYESTSRTGVSSIVVEFEAEADLKESYQKLRDQVNLVHLPSDAFDPAVTEIRINDFPFVTYSVIGKDIDIYQLNTLATQISDEIETLSDVSKVEKSGAIVREFQVNLSLNRMQELGMSLSQIVGSISSNFVNLPAGNIEVDDFSYAVRVQGKFPDIDALKSIVVTSNNGVPVYLSDVATIQDTFKDQSTISRIGFNNEESQQAITLSVFQKNDADVLRMVEESDKKIDSVQEEIQDRVRIEKTNDFSVFITDDLSRLGWGGVQTMILIVLILFMILGVRESIITSLSVPLAFFMAFIGLMVIGDTLNGMVLFALVLSLGLMVDNSIVIMEGINEYMKKHKFTGHQAAILSVWNYKWPIISGTMTTVSAFVPMLLVSGIMGEYLSVLPKTISLTLLSSLFVALVVLPTLSAKFIKKNGEKKEHKWNFLSQIIEWLKPKYIRFLSDVVPDKKKRRKFIVTAWVFFVIALALPISGAMKVEMFPKVDIDFFYVNVEMPVGTVLEKTDEITREIETLVSKIPEMKNYVTTVGSGGSHKAQITVNLELAKDRERKSFEITNDLREEIGQYPKADVSIEELNAGPPTGAPIQVRIFGENISELAHVSSQMQTFFDEIPGVINIEDNIENSTGDITFRIKLEEAASFGLTTGQVANVIRSALFGVEAGELNIDGEEVDITVALENAYFDDISDLEQLLIPTPKGQMISVNQVADFTLEPSLLAINHRDGRNVVAINADVQEGVNVSEVLQQFEEKLSNFAIPTSVTYEIGGEVEDIQQSFTETFTSMIVAVMLIAFILVLQFNSFKQPFIILFSLPLGVIGVMFGLQVVNVPFGFAVFIGIVALTGILVNDAIVLIDKINKNIRNGKEFIDAIVDAGQARMEPILLTSLTTIAGIFPLIFADEFWAGLGLTIVFGLLFATVLTLVIVPLMYASLVKEKDFT